MKILIVYAHPEPTSFNHALHEQAIETLKDQHEIQVSDLYAMHFNAVANWQDYQESFTTCEFSSAQHEAFQKNKLSPDIQEEQSKLTWCDFIIFQFPLWWFSVPAILKGWLDRVLTSGFAFDKNKWFATGLLQPRRAMLSVTTQSPFNTFQEGGLHGDIHQYLKPIHHALHFVGITTLAPHIAYAVNIDQESRTKYLNHYREHLLKMLSK